MMPFLESLHFRSLVSLNYMYVYFQAIPLYHSIVSPPEILTADMFKSLPTLLATKIGHDAFCAFLQSEFSVENLYFWKEVLLKSLPAHLQN